MSITKTIITALLLLLFVAGAQAQQTGTISGKVNLPNEKGATPSVSLLGAKDSAVIKSSVLSANGVFVFANLVNGNYIVAVSSVGFKKSYSSIIALTTEQPTAIISEMNLVPSPKSMATITVTTKKPLIEQKVDRTIVNVEASITNVGATALEVLEKAPGVTVDKDGNISLKGKEGVMVLIDGRPSQLGGVDLANYLRNMNASQMDQVEIMTNPPARFDASGNAGVINIKTKKRNTIGYNGSLSLNYSQGRYPKINEGFNFNYRKGNINLFGNLNHGWRKNFNVLTIQRNIRNANTKELENYFDQRSDKTNEGSNYNARMGIDYFAGKKTSFGVALNGYYSPNNSFNNNLTQISSANKELENVTKATVENASVWKNFSSNFNFRRVFDSTGKELTADFDYSKYNSENDQFMINSFFDATGANIRKADSLQGSIPQKINIQSGRIDYVHPLKNGARWEAGIKSSLVETDNNAVYDSLLYGTVIRDVNRSNHFIYDETIHAAYINHSRSLSKKINAQFGLRLESTIAHGRQLTTRQEFERKYTQLFPTAYLQYKADEKNNFGVNYGRRIRRPNYESLNPFIRFLDRYTYSQGNPDLKPQFSHNIELSHTYRNRITTTINYTATNDIIQSVIEQKGQEAYAKQSNIASLRQYGLSINANTPLTKWWTNNLYVNVYSNNFTGIISNEPVSFSAVQFSFSGSQQFNISKSFSAELSGNFASGGVQGVMKMKPRGMVSAGISQQVLKNNGTIRVSVRDIFFTQQARAVANYANVDAAFQEYGDSRVLSVGFSFRFSKGKMNNQKRKTAGSADEEQNRVGVN